MCKGHADVMVASNVPPAGYYEDTARPCETVKKQNGV